MDEVVEVKISKGLAINNTQFYAPPEVQVLLGAVSNGPMMTMLFIR